MNALFETVLSMSLSAAFLVAMIIGLRWCFRKIPRWVTCTLWALVAVRLLIPGLPESELSMVPERVSDSQAVVEFVSELPAPVFREPEPTEAPEISERPSPAVETQKQSFDWMKLLSRVWIAGVVLMGCYGLWSYLRIRRKVAPSVPVGKGVWLCDYIDTPFLLGLFRPRIYLPSYLDTETAGYVLRHERAHLRRRDHFWKPLGFVLLSFHWFNPMLWVGYCLLCRDIETACDEAVIHTMAPGEKKGYSQALLSCSVQHRMISICPLAFGEVSVKDRVKSVLNYKKPALWLTVIGLAVLILGSVFFLTNPVKNAEEPKFYPTAQYVANDQILTIYEYDENMEGSAVSIYIDGVLRSRTDFVREKNGNLVTITQTDTVYSDPSQVGTVTTTVIERELDRNDHILKEEKFRNGQLISTALYDYDRKGNLLSMDATYPGFSQRQEHTYDRRGNTLSDTILMDTNGDGQMDQSQEERYTRDKEGRLLTSESYTDGVLSNRCRYTYDEETNTQLCEEVENRSGTLTTLIAYYTEYGNILCVEGDEANMYCNYIGEDGTRIIGIPEDIYTEGSELPQPLPELTQPETTESEPVNRKDDPDINSCLAVINDIQGRDHWRIRTYYDNDPWSESTAWLRGTDRMVMTRLPGENGDIQYGELCIDGNYYKAGPKVYSGEFTPRWTEAEYPKDRVGFFDNPPWLLSVGWDLYDIQLTDRTEDQDGWNVRLSMISQNREICPEDYDVTFRFTLDGDFLEADLLIFEDEDQISHQMIYIESTDWDEVSAQMDAELARATK